KELGYTLSEAQFQSYLDSVKKDSKIETEEQFQAALKQENMTLADLRKNIEKTAIMSHVQQSEVLGKVSVSEEDARKYYEAHKKEFTTPQAITLREIFVNVSGEGAAAEDQARAKANGIRARIVAGEGFDKLATEVSDAP